MPTIELSRPTAQYTEGHEDAHVQFAWRIAATDGASPGVWHRESYSPAQAQLAKRAPAALLAIAPGAWGDAELRADVRDWIAAQYGFTEMTFLGVAP